MACELCQSTVPLLAHMLLNLLLPKFYLYWPMVCLRKHPHRHMTSFPSSLCTEIQALTNLASHPNPIPFPWILPLSSCLLWLLIYLLLHIFLLCRQIAHAHRILLFFTTFSDLHYSMPVKLSHVIYFRKKKFQRHSLLHHERSKAPCLNPPASLSENNWNPVLHAPQSHPTLLFPLSLSWLWS